MASSKFDPDFNDRAKAAANARQAALEKFRAKANDPAAEEQRAALAATRAAREARKAAAEQERKAREAIAKQEAEAAAKLKAEADKIEAAAKAERDELLKVQQKAARDERYAARKKLRK